MTAMLQDATHRPHPPPGEVQAPLPLHCAHAPATHQDRDADRNRARPRARPCATASSPCRKWRWSPRARAASSRWPRPAAAPRVALRHAEAPEHFLSTVQVGITLVMLITGAVAGDALGDHIAEALHGGRAPGWCRTPAIIGFALGFVVISFIQIVFGELVPKRLALAAPERAVAPTSAIPMLVLSRAQPRRSCGCSTCRSNLVLRLLRVNAARPRRGDRRGDPPAGGRERRTGRAGRRRAQHGQPRAAPGRPHGGQRDDAAHAHRLAGYRRAAARKTSRCCAKRPTRATRSTAATRATWSAWSR